LARRFDPSKKLQVLFGTPEFVAPEVVNFEQIGFGTDLWSVGIICYVLLSGLSPFMGETDVETMANVTIAKYDFDDEAFNDVSEEAKDLISKLLVKSISKRLTATECLRHSWLQIKPLPKETPKTVQTTAEEVSQLLSTKEVGELLPSKEVGEVPPAKEVDEPLPASESNQPLEKPPEKAPPIPTNSTPSAAEPDSVVPPLSYVAEIPVPVAEPTQPYTKPIHKDQTRIKDCVEEMLLTKKNLRQFVERWSSHPNSPFLYDGSRRTTISLISPTGPPPISWSQIPSRASLSGMSPSAPSSLASPWQSPAQVLETCDASQSAVFNHYSIDGPQPEPEGVCQQQAEANCNNNMGHSDTSNNNVAAKNAKDSTSDSNVKISIEETSALLKSVTEKLLHQMETGTAVGDRTGARIWERTTAVEVVSSELITSEKNQVSQCQVKTEQPLDQSETANLSQKQVSIVSIMSADEKATQPPDNVKARLPDRKCKSPIFGDHIFGGNGLVHVIRKTETFTSSDKKFKGFSLPDKKPKIASQQRQQQQQKQQQQQQQQTDHVSKTHVGAMDVHVEKLKSNSSGNSNISRSRSSGCVSKENMTTAVRPNCGPMTDDNIKVESPSLVADGDWEFHPPVAARTMGISKRHKGSTLSTLSTSTMSTSSSVIHTEGTLITDKENTLSVAYSVSNTSTVVKMETQL